jgi:hypothetical protein
MSLMESGILQRFEEAQRLAASATANCVTRDNRCPLRYGEAGALEMLYTALGEYLDRVVDALAARVSERVRERCGARSLLSRCAFWRG